MAEHLPFSAKACRVVTGILTGHANGLEIDNLLEEADNMQVCWACAARLWCSIAMGNACMAHWSRARLNLDIESGELGNEESYALSFFIAYVNGDAAGLDALIETETCEVPAMAVLELCAQIVRRPTIFEVKKW